MTEVGKYTYWQLCEIGTPAELTAAMIDEGEANAPLVSTNTSRKCDILWARMDIFLVNGSAHPVYCQMYICEARRDLRYDAHTDLFDAVNEMLRTGWYTRMDSADEDVAFTDRVLNTSHSSLTPYMSNQFCTAFKIVRVISGTLIPGAQNHVVVRLRKKNNYRSATYGTTHATGIMTIGRYTRIVLCRFTTSLGHDSTTLGQVAQLAAVLSARVKKKYRFSYNSNNLPLLGIVNSENATFGAGGELVSQYADVADEGG